LKRERLKIYELLSVLFHSKSLHFSFKDLQFLI
jgi:hypothetical protein